MADNNFFNLLRDKMAALRPVEQHRKDDWAALGARLNVALPPRKRRRAIVLPLLLIAALISSNAVWWQSSRSDRAALAQLDAQMKGLQAVVSALPAKVSQVVVRTDTIWRTVYVQRAANNRQTRFIDTTQRKVESELRLAAHPKAAVSPMANGSARPGFDSHSHTDRATGVKGATDAINILDQQKGLVLNAEDSITQLPALPNLEMRKTALLELTKREVVLPQMPVIAPLSPENTTPPFGQSLLAALRPKFFKVGGNLGWLFANSSGLMHEGGFSSNLRGQVGLSRHWSVTAEFGLGKLHYKAHAPEAVLGTPDLPMLPSAEHHFAEIDVTGQKIQQFHLGLRYTFAQPGKPRPFLGLSWGGQSLLPFTIEYEIQHEPTGMIQKGAFEITTRTRLRNILGLSGGLDLPLSSRFDLTLEGFYQRQWKKPNSIAPDLIEIRAGVNWLF